MDEYDVQWLMAPDAPGPALLVKDLCHRPAWHADAACRTEPVETFFPVRATAKALSRVNRLCDACRVRSECLEFALQDPVPDGWWAGTHPRLRTAMRLPKKVEPGLYAGLGTTSG